MRPRTKKIVLAVSVAATSIVAASLARSRSIDSEWNVIAVGLPGRVAPSSANINMGSYILRQTHEPVFRNDKDGHFYSNVLANWNRDLSNGKYTFCVDRTKTFRAGRAFELDDLEETLKRLNSVELGITNIDRLGPTCLSVHAIDPQLRVLAALTDYWAAPSISTNNPLIEDGLGAFQVTLIDKNQVFMKRKTPVSGGFDTIRMVNISSLSEEQIRASRDEDLNRIYVEKVPLEVKSSYVHYDLPLLQTRDLIINVDDDRIRRVIWHCASVNELRQALMPDQPVFRDVATVMPVGVDGGKHGLVDQKCDEAMAEYKASSPKKSPGGKGRDGALYFLNWKASAKDSLDDFWDRFSKKTGIRVEIDHGTESRMIETVLTVPHPYDLYIVSLDAVKIDRLPFVEFFFRPEQAAVDFVPMLRSELAKRHAGDWKDAPAEDFISVIQGMNVAMPLYQEVRRFYYPADITGFDFSLNYLQYPEVAKLRR